MWYSASQLATLHLPKLPSSKRGMQKVADRQNWKFRPRQGRGGGKEYHISSLPEETQAYLGAKNNERSQSKTGNSGNVGGTGDFGGSEGERFEVLRVEQDVRGTGAGREGFAIAAESGSGEGGGGGLGGVFGEGNYGHKTLRENDEEFTTVIGLYEENYGAGGLSSYGGGGSGFVGNAIATPIAQSGGANFGFLEPTTGLPDGTMCSQGGVRRRCSDVRRNDAGSTVVTRLNPSERARAKYAIVQAFEKFVGENPGRKMMELELEFCERYRRREFELDTYETIGKFSRSTLCNYRQKLREGASRLEDGYENVGKNRKGKGKIASNARMVQFIEGHIYTNPRISAKHLHELLAANFEGGELPCERTVNRFLLRWQGENKELYVHLVNPDKHKSGYQPAFGSYSENLTRLNELWELDSTPADILLRDGRYTVVGCVDVITRRSMLLVSKTSRAVAIAALLRRCILEWGVPEKIKTDNGKDYVSYHVRRVVDDLGIKQVLCEPFHPEQKPHVERFFRTFSHDLLQFMPGFAGHNVAERRDIRSRESFGDRLMSRRKNPEPVELGLTNEEFQVFCDRWLNSYHHDEHEGLRGLSPLERLASFSQVIRTVSSDRALDILLAEPPKNRFPTVNKAGLDANFKIAVDKQEFIAPELGEWMRQKVEVRYDPFDYGKLYVFSLEGKFICVAQSNLSGVDRQKVATEAKRRNKAKISKARKDLKNSARSIDTNDIANEILTARENKQNLVAFPKAAEEHFSEGLTEAEKAVQAAEESQILSQPPARKPEVPEILIRDNSYYHKLWRELRAGECLPVEELKRMRRYIGTPEGKALLPRLQVTKQVVDATLDEAIGEAQAV